MKISYNDSLGEILQFDCICLFDLDNLCVISLIAPDTRYDYFSELRKYL